MIKNDSVTVFLKNKKIIPRIVVISILLTSFFSSGYLFSDDLFFKKLIIKNNIQTPLDAFEFVNNHTKDREGDNLQPGQIATHTLETDKETRLYLQPGQTPRYLLTQRHVIWCDEGAVILATILHELNYKTKLVDLINEDGISNHTILEVYQEGRWVRYDTQNDIYDLSYEQIAGYKATPVSRKYPKLYNSLVQNNYYSKKIVLFLRGLDG